VALREFGKYWIPVLAWMALIFSASTDLGSTRNTSRIIGPILRWVWPRISEQAIHDVQVCARKTGHMTGYAVLAVLLCRARRGGIQTLNWTRRDALFAETISVLYAISDEFHQSFVPTREASGWDVLIDACGAALGLAAIWALGRMRRKW
jgi:VanZ family protein